MILFKELEATNFSTETFTATMISFHENLHSHSLLTR